MKKITIMTLFMGAVIMMNAQTEKGAVLVGASSDLNFSSGKTDNDQNDSETQISLNVRAGIFVIDGLAAGLDLGFSTISIGDGSSTSFGVGPFARYYLENNVFGELSYSILSSNFDPGQGDSSKASGGDLGIGAGYAIFIGDNVALEPLLNFHLTSLKPDGASESISGSNFGMDVGFTFFF